MTTKTETGKVVVQTSLSIERLKGGAMYAAHLNGLGLTAYGRAPSEARAAVKGLFKTWVDGYRRLGVLEKRLDRVGADWRWCDDYKGDIPVEDTTDVGRTLPFGSGERMQTAADEPVAMAA